MQHTSKHGFEERANKPNHNQRFFNINTQNTGFHATCINFSLFSVCSQSVDDVTYYG